MHGLGQMFLSNGDKYVGNWTDCKKNGKGVYYFVDGSVFDGNWVDDQVEGKGRMQTSEMIYDGDWIKC